MDKKCLFAVFGKLTANTFCLVTRCFYSSFSPKMLFAVFFRNIYVMCEMKNETLLTTSSSAKDVTHACVMPEICVNTANTANIHDNSIYNKAFFLSFCSQFRSHSRSQIPLSQKQGGF